MLTVLDKGIHNSLCPFRIRRLQSRRRVTDVNFPNISRSPIKPIPQSGVLSPYSASALENRRSDNLTHQPFQLNVLLPPEK
jgi:hypothetical protein